MAAIKPQVHFSPSPMISTNTAADTKGVACMPGAPHLQVPQVESPAPRQPKSGSVKIDREMAFGEELGSGTFGRVVKGTLIRTQTTCAIKIIEYARLTSGDKAALLREIKNMQKLDHPRIVKLMQVFKSPERVYLALEFMAGGELFGRLDALGQFTEDQARMYFTQMVDGLAHCHDQGICHRDLKLENLLLDSDGNLKISDFGFSHHNALVETTCGTPSYIAPEVLLGAASYDGRAADIWSCGVILYVLLAGKLPFDEIDMRELFRKILRADYEVPATFSPAATHLLRAMLTSAPAARLTAAQIKNHPWCKAEAGDFAHADNEVSETAPQRADIDAAADKFAWRYRSARLGQSSRFLRMTSAESQQLADEMRAARPLSDASMRAGRTGLAAINVFDIIGAASGNALKTLVGGERAAETWLVLKQSQDAAFAATCAALNNMSDVEFSEYPQYGQIRVVQKYLSSNILIALTLVCPTPDMVFVQCKRCGGDALMYRKWYAEFKSLGIFSKSASYSESQLR